MTITDHHVKDLGLAEAGERRIRWAATEMPVLSALAARFSQTRPLDRVRVSACLHVTAETANLVRVLRGGGAEVRVCASNPLSTQDDVAAALVANDAVPTFAIRGEDTETYYRHIEAALDHGRPHEHFRGPELTLDDGADLVGTLHTRHTEMLARIVGGMEETTTGVTRLRAMAKEGALRYPVIAVNDAMSKHFFDNRYGTGRARSTASSARRTSCSLARSSPSRATAGAGAGSRCARREWARASS
jgi:adenosylhomocysteinase